MRILFAFENPLPSPEADAEVFTTNAEIPRSPGRAVVAARAGPGPLQLRCGLRPGRDARWLPPRHRDGRRRCGICVAD